jgi:hypothetical protein
MLPVDERYLPITITVPGMTDEKFLALCERYEDYFLECSADGEVTISAQRDPETGVRNAAITAQPGTGRVRAAPATPPRRAPASDFPAARVDLPTQPGFRHSIAALSSWLN